ncbi:hypothetical protein K458DRAFT_159500 [Lentithecium fluviatile CBS 122367]|uniref:Secreted protein n=1 Tax=Lentithecium fluviatile CBS 122367 TaxID=1168545 RepID=A0A6G1IH88_9PLEO|nr:hypothetical protein K458DRAFT_159500 [Lentithecium fluviatile CBS 122367]
MSCFICLTSIAGAIGARVLETLGAIIPSENPSQCCCAGAFRLLLRRVTPPQNCIFTSSHTNTPRFRPTSIVCRAITTNLPTQALLVFQVASGEYSNLSTSTQQTTSWPASPNLFEIASQNTSHNSHPCLGQH